MHQFSRAKEHKHGEEHQARVRGMVTTLYWYWPVEGQDFKKMVKLKEEHIWRKEENSCDIWYLVNISKKIKYLEIENFLLLLEPLTKKHNQFYVLMPYMQMLTLWVTLVRVDKYGGVVCYVPEVWSCKSKAPTI